MLKLIGSVMVLLACVGYAGGLLRQIVRHRDILKSCMELTELLTGEIRYERIPIAEALRRIQGKVDDELSKILCAVADSMEKGDYGSMEEVWNRNFAQAGKGLLLTEEEMQEVKNIGKNLGFLDFDVQVSHLTGCRERLKRSLDKIQKELDEKKKLYRSLSLAAGIFAILILL